MARIRTIKPEFWTSEQVVECSPTARLLFIGIWTFSDDGGVHPYSTKRIKMEVFPGDTLSDEEVLKFIEELIRAKLLRVFESNGEQFLHVTGWKHQKIDKPSYRWPQPNGSTKFVDSSPTIRRAFVDSSPPEWKGGESIGDISSSSVPDEGARSQHQTEEPFAKWWKLVPRKVGKADARKAYAKAVKIISGRSPDEGPGASDPHGFLRDRMTEFAKSTSGRAAGKFCPYPATWLNDARYDDDPTDWEHAGEQPVARVVTPEEFESLGIDLMTGAVR